MVKKEALLLIPVGVAVFWGAVLALLRIGAGVVALAMFGIWLFCLVLLGVILRGQP